MKGLSLQQLDAALRASGHGPSEGENHVVFKDEIIRLFEAYGDDYFRDHGDNAPFELCRENPIWKEARNRGAITIREGHKV